MGGKTNKILSYKFNSHLSYIASYAKSCRNYIDLCDDIEDVTYLKKNASEDNFNADVFSDFPYKFN